MKFISLNVAIKIDNSQKVAEFIQSEQPDIVAFQEIIRHFDDSVFDMYQSKSKIEKIIGPGLPYSFFGPQWFAYADIKNNKVCRDFGGKIEQGNEVISRFPIKRAANEHYHKSYEDSSDRTNFHTDDHARSVAIVELDVAGQPLQILTLHGLYTRDKKDIPRTIKQSKYIIEAAKRKKNPTIIAGDFNLLPDTKSIALMEKEFSNLIKEYKITSTIPKFDHGTETTKKGVLDYIFINDQIKVNDFQVRETDISDHLPLILDFDIVD
ncbi:MAG: endonuclease/exonuclease/phosphatase family protein [Patescibacteria group bacterium]